jgi:hypothetical protein
MKPNDRDLARDFDGLIHPSQAFEHPRDVVSDPDLSLNQKRAILASWASDASAIEAAPALRKTPAGRVVSFDEIMDAMRALDKELLVTQHARPKLTRVSSIKRRTMSGPGNQGAPLH